MGPLNLPASKSDVFAELARFEDAIRTAQATGKRPRLPLDDAPTGFRAVTGFIFHSLLYLLTRLMLGVRAYRIAVWFAQQRVRYDPYWHEPRACGLASAYTDLGVALMRLGDLGGAVQYLQKSWHVFPCPHLTSYGLPTKLVCLLESEDRVRADVEEFRHINDRFRGRA